MGRRHNEKGKSWRHEGYSSKLAEEFRIGEYVILNRQIAIGMVRKMTASQRKIAIALTWGLSYQQIADILGIKRYQVHGHIASMVNSLGCRQYGIPLIVIMAEGIRRPDELFDCAFWEKVPKRKQATHPRRADMR